MTSKQRAYLKGLAHHVEPIVHIGKNGVTPEVIQALNEALESNELVKISILNNCMESSNHIIEATTERTHSEFVQFIGKKVVLYRPSKNNPKIELPKQKKSKPINAFLLAFIFAISVFSNGTTTLANTFGHLNSSAFATVVQIVDGDSFVAVLDNSETPVLVRMLGVDSQGYTHSVAFLNEILLGRQVILTVDPNFSNRDTRWSLAYVNINDGNSTFVNSLMLSTGHAKLNSSHLLAQRFSTLRTAEQTASSRRIGIWNVQSTVSSSTNTSTTYRGNGININTATSSQLADRLDISTSVANNIITYRENNPFNTIDEIKFVTGFTKSMYDRNVGILTVVTNINNATDAELRTLGSLTTTEVNRIISHRNSNTFRNIRDLTNEDLISSSRYNAIRDFISVDNISTIDTVIPNETVVNINTATAAQLERVGLSSSQANAIINNRANYSYKTLGELSAVANSFNRTTLDRWSDNLSYMTDINTAFRSEIESLLGSDSTSSLVTAIINGRPYRNLSSLQSVLPNNVYQRISPFIYLDRFESDRVNINTASTTELTNIGLTSAEASRIRSQAGRMTTSRDIPINISNHDESVALYTNINTASERELLSLHEDMTQSVVNSITNYRNRDRFGDLDEVREFFNDIRESNLYSSIRAFIVVR